ncbi:MAG: hypothetical protein NDF55_08900 [archaeon GB-1867-005]|nr:hypothetical protein [Candidatus Culexmicrobium cathedralense]
MKIYNQILGYIKPTTQKIKLLLRIAMILMAIASLPLYIGSIPLLFLRVLLIIGFLISGSISLVYLGFLHRKTKLGKATLILGIISITSVLVFIVADVMLSLVLQEMVNKSIGGETVEEELINYASSLLIARQISAPFLILSSSLIPFLSWINIKKAKYLENKIFTICSGLAIIFFVLFIGQLFSITGSLFLKETTPEDFIRSIYELLFVSVPTFILSILLFRSYGKVKGGS